jgi:murein DD-endopeptidase MepM/ murein hydrolase activator NlpD
MARVTARCVVCGGVLYADDDQLVLATGRRREPHCSQECLAETLRVQGRARAVRRRRAIAGLSVLALLLAGAWTLRRHRAPQPRSISAAWEDHRWKKPVPPGPNFFGPAWPPTDDDWTFAFGRVSWTYPLPGPVRRVPTVSDRMFTTDGAAKRPPAICRKPGTCGVRLGGQLWGEHVYAVLDGVVDVAKGYGGEEHGGGYVRIAHFGGMVFTHYFHLAAVPRGVSRGRAVAAGDVIGLVGDTGVGVEGPGTRAHLHFALSVRPSNQIPEEYWDPVAMMESWRLRVPPNGTVAGLAAPVVDEDLVRRRRGR